MKIYVYYVETETTKRFRRAFKSQVAAHLWAWLIGQRMAWHALARCNPALLERVTVYTYRYEDWSGE